METGRNFAEILRVIDALQLAGRHQVITPANWKPGEDVIICPSLSDEEAKEAFPAGWKAPKPYLRLVPQLVSYARLIRRLEACTSERGWTRLPLFGGICSKKLHVWLRRLH